MIADSDGGLVATNQSHALTIDAVQSLFEHEGFEFTSIPLVNDMPTIRGQIGESVVEIGGEQELSTILLTGAIRDGDSARHMGSLATVLLEYTEPEWDALGWYNEQWTTGINALEQGLPGYRTTTEQHDHTLDMLVSTYDSAILVRLKIYIEP